MNMARETGMNQMDELESRLTAALEKIGAGLDAMSAAAEARGRAAAEAEAPPAPEPAAPEADPEELERLRTELDEERLANAQLEARVKALKERLEAHDAGETAPAGGAEQLPEALARLDAELQRLREANDKLRESNAALREANAEGVGEPHLINSAMLAELESMRALRASEAAESSSIMSQLVPLLGSARNLPEGEDA